MLVTRLQDFADEQMKECQTAQAVVDIIIDNIDTESILSMI